MFDAIGEGHKILNESVKKKVNLNELERLIKKKPVCADDIMDILCTVPDLIAENRALREKVQKLERQREYLACELSTDDDQADCNHSHLSCEHRKGWLCCKEKCCCSRNALPRRSGKSIQL